MSYIGYGRIGGESWIVPVGRQLLIPDTLGLAFVNETTLGLSRISASTMGLGSSDAGNNLNIYATLGAEKITWTAAGWDEGGVEWTVAGTPIVITHATGNTTALTSTLASAIVAGVTYKVVITYAQVAGTCSYTLGGVLGTSIATSAGSTSITDYITAATTAQMIITPLTTSNIVISAISIKALTDATGDLTVDGNLTVRSPAIFNASLEALTSIITDGATANITTAQMKGQVHRITGAYTLSLPAAVPGLNAEFIATTAAVFSLDVQVATDIIILNGVSLAAGNKATSDASINATIFLECTAAGTYRGNAILGVFSDGGA